MKRKLFC